MTDCSTNMCPVCDPTKEQNVCTGVVGAAQPSQTGGVAYTDNTNPIWKYGNSTYVPQLRQYYDDPDCLSGQNFGISDAYGKCINTSFGINNSRLTRKTNLVVGSSQDSSTSLDNFPYETPFEIQALHKAWGSVGNGILFNRGVNSKNVYVETAPENINYKLNGNSYSKNQRVLYMEAHGDKYNGTVPGIGKGEVKNNLYCLDSSNNVYQGTSTSAKTACKQGDNPLYGCNSWYEIESSYDSNWNKRVGGCAATKDNFGPGVYNLLCYVPKTDDDSTDGRGYVFAVWPFHYEEIYSDQSTQYRQDIPCYNECGANSGAACPEDKCDKENDGFFSAINHEIDIEIPCNSPQFADDWKNKMTWSTMNCNTWNNDINNYDADTGAFYTQVAVQNNNGLFISSSPEESTSKDYHWYTIDWYVDPGSDGNNDYTNNYVAFYFDDPFDPYQTTTVNGNKLPKAPSNAPLHKTNRFVPTRSGRLNFGPWMAWWGYNGQKGGIPNFDTVKVRLAHLSIIPYQDQNLWPKGVYYNEFPQSYDQMYTNCDFKRLAGDKPPVPSQPAKSKLLFIILGIVIMLLVAGGYYYYKNKKKLFNK